MTGLRKLERRFDLVAYLKQMDDDAKVYGSNIAIRDPVCGKEQKLWVLTEDKPEGTRAGSWICFSCQESGTSPLSLVRRLEDCDAFHAYEVLSSFQTEREGRADLRALVDSVLAGLDEPAEVDAAPVSPIPLPDEFVFYEHARAKPGYFHTRGIDMRRARRYALGFCRTGYYRHRLVVPVMSMHKVVFFVARYMRTVPPTGVKKVVYPVGAKPSRFLFNYDRAKHGHRIIVVEGVFDAMAIGDEAVATFGTHLSTHQLELLLKTAASELIIMWDADAITKAYDLAERLSEFWSPVRVVKLARDPDEHTRDELRVAIAEARALDPCSAFRGNVEARLT
jgi:hypothetical protein